MTEKLPIKAIASFSQCSVDQIATILARRHFVTIKKFTEIEFKISMVHLLCENVTPKKWTKFSREEKVRHFNYIRWTLKEKVTTRPFDVLMVKTKRLMFAKDNFEDTTSLEFSLANIYYLSFTKPNEEKPDFEALYSLMAIFIRPRQQKLWDWKHTNKRDEYDSDKAVINAKFLRENLPFGLTLAFLEWFQHTNNNFLERNKELLEGGDGKPLFFNGEGWIAMLEDIAESGVHGNFDDVCNKPVHTIFMYLRHTKTRLDRQIEDHEAANRFE